MNTQIQRLHCMVLLAVLAVLVSVAITGCHHADTIVGKWSDADPTKPGDQAQLVVEFKPNGTVTQTIITPLESISYQANYTAKEGLLTETRTSVTLNGHSTPLNGIDTYQYGINNDALTINGTDGSAPYSLFRGND